nr:hypothetical protein [Pseudoalteromonas sp. SA25]
MVEYNVVKGVCNNVFGTTYAANAKVDTFVLFLPIKWCVLLM